MKTLLAQVHKFVSRPRVELALASCFFLLVAALATFYITKTYNAYINSDSATSNILAGEIARSGQFFPKDWWYVNGDLWVLFKHVFVLPWALLGNNGFAAHAGAVLAGSAIMVASAYALLRHTGCTRTRAIMGASVLCFGFSDYYLETVFGEAAYAWSASYLFVLLTLLLRLSTSITKNKSPTWPLIGLFTLVAVVALANPTRFIVFFVAPIAGALMVLTYQRLTNQKDQQSPIQVRRGVAAGIGVCLAAFVLAFISHRALLAGLSNSAGASAAVLVPIENLPQTFGYAVSGILTLLGVGWVPGIKLASLPGLLVLAKFTLYPVLLIAPALVMWANDATLSREQRFVTLTGYLGFALIFLLVSASTLQGGNAILASYTTRYLLPFILLIMLANFFIWPLHGTAVKILLVSGLVFAFAGSWAYVSPAKLRLLETQSNAANIGYSFRPDWRQQVEKKDRTVKALLDAGLSVGYAPYWHSHLYTVASKGALEVRPVHMTDGNVRPWLHLSSSRWYKSGYAKGPVFILVPKTESASLLPGLLGTCMPEPSSQLEIEDYLVLVYKVNPLIGRFDRNLDGEGSVCISATSRTQVGQYNKAHASLDAPANKVGGYLHFGPYSLFQPGSYAVRFDLRVDAPSGGAADIGYVEVTAENGTKLLKRQALASGADPRILNIAVSEKAAQNVELRVYSTGSAQMSLSGICVQKVR